MIALAIATIENDADRRLVEELYTKHYALMLHRAQSMVRDRQAAEDIVETVMLRLIQRLELLRGCNRASLRSYLVACVRNEAIDRLRREGRFRGPEDSGEKLLRRPDDAPTAEALLIDEARVQAVAGALERLEDRERLALRLKYYDQMTDAAIAKLFGMSRSGVRKVIDRARRHVGALLKAEGWL